MTLLAESYFRFFDFPEGVVGVMADVHIVAGVVELEGLLIYPRDVPHIALGTAKLRTIYRAIEAEIAAAGYPRFRILGKRVTGASRGRLVNVRRTIQ